MYFVEGQLDDGLHLCVTDLLASNLSSNTWPRTDPYVSFRTTRDREIMRLDATGVSCSTIHAGVYGSLAASYDSANILRPPSEYALNTAYVTLSNLIAVRTTSLADSSNPAGGATTVLDALGLVDSYLSESVLEAPTASALRAAYLSLSNQMVANFYQQSVALGMQAAAASSTSSSNVSVTPNPDFFATDRWLFSEELQARFKFEKDASTWLASASNFYFFDNTMQRNTATLDAGGTLRLRGGVAAGAYGTFGGDVAVAGSLRMGPSTVLTHDGGSNLGLNLPDGVSPAYTLHVNGAMFATEQLFSLSDMRAKTRIRRIRAPLDIVQGIRGYTYTMRDRPDRQCVGVLAQEVATVLPEAVSTVRGKYNEQCASLDSASLDSASLDPLLSVSYDGLVGVLFEAVAELADQIRELKDQLK
jgi:hypothetical protein